MSMLEFFYEQVRGLVENVQTEGQEIGYWPLFRPVAPFNQPSFLTPLITVAALTATLVLSGVAVGALATLLLALLVLFLLLREVFGVSFEFHTPAF